MDFGKNMTALAERFRGEWMNANLNESLTQYFQLLTNNFLFIASVQQDMHSRVENSVVGKLSLQMDHYKRRREAAYKELEEVRVYDLDGAGAEERARATAESSESLL